MAASVASSAVVFEVLSKENYESWSVIVKNYLVGEGLWDGVVSGGPRVDHENNDDWETKNAKALHAIQLSCGPDILSVIRKIGHARDAWSRLSGLFSPDFQGNADNEQRIGNNPLHRSVERGDWNAAAAIIMEYVNRNNNDDIVFECNSSGKSILHIAVIAGRERIVENLVNTQNERLLEMQDNDGYTALAQAARLNGKTEMARYMVEKNEGLLKTAANNQIPVVLAAAAGHKEMTRYLYHKTPEFVLTENDCHYGCMLLTHCMTAEIFDVALKLLHSRTPIPLTGLPRESYDRWPTLCALARMPSVFLSGCQFTWWQRIIYAILRPQYRDPNRWIIIKIISHVEDAQEMYTLPGRFWQKVKNLRCLKIIGRYWQKVTNLPCVKALGKRLREFLMGIQDLILLKFPAVKDIYDKKLTHYLVRQILDRLRDRVRDFDEDTLREVSAYDAMLQAAKCGIIEFIESMEAANPDLLWAIDRNNRSVFSHAILNRKEEVFNLLGKIEGRRERITSREDAFGNNLLHLAAELGPSSDLGHNSGAALQMQKEIQWFKEVEKIVHPMCKEAKNADSKKPREVFTKSHEQLVKEGAKWAKDTATSFTIVCTLIITIMFAAAFTVPGKNSQANGFPTYSSKKHLFEVFMMADAISLAASSTSVLISIGILTSRYAEENFLWILPLKLLFDLFFLFLSVVAMMVAFCTGIAMLQSGYLNVVIVAISLAIIPICVFMMTQIRLFREIYMSTIGLNVFAAIIRLP